MSRIFVVGAVLLLVGLACDSTVTVEGSVRDERGAPIANASIDLDCEPWGTRLGFPVYSGSDGSFDAFGIGCLPKHCSILATASGYRRTVQPVGPKCIDSNWYCNDSNCNRLKVPLTLHGE